MSAGQAVPKVINKAIPKLRNVSPNEQHAVTQMFKYYDTQLKGLIPYYLARNIMKQLGFDEGSIETAFSGEVTLREILLFLDQAIPDPDPQLVLEGALISFNGMVAKPQQDLQGVTTNVLMPQDISDFYESLGRPAASLSEATLMLNAMSDYDDCSETPALDAAVFSKEVGLYAKKSNCLKEYELSRGR